MHIECIDGHKKRPCQLLSKEELGKLISVEISSSSKEGKILAAGLKHPAFVERSKHMVQSTQGLAEPK
jgi:hypothetical protein